MRPLSLSRESGKPCRQCAPPSSACRLADRVSALSERSRSSGARSAGVTRPVWKVMASVSRFCKASAAEADGSACVARCRDWARACAARRGSVVGCV